MRFIFFGRYVISHGKCEATTYLLMYFFLGFFLLFCQLRKCDLLPGRMDVYSRRRLYGNLSPFSIFVLHIYCKSRLIRTVDFFCDKSVADSE